MHTHAPTKHTPAPSPLAPGAPAPSPPACSTGTRCQAGTRHAEPLPAATWRTGTRSLPPRPHCWRRSHPAHARGQVPKRFMLYPLTRANVIWYHINTPLTVAAIDLRS